MAEIPLVVVNVQRGGPSTGQPTKAEQGDLLTAIFGSHGDAPKVVMAASTVEDCFYSVITARKIAETFNMVVVVLSDANLATSQTPFPRPAFNEAWVAPPIDQSPVPAGAKPYDWDPETGLARRFVPGQPGGMHTVTGLAHDRASHVAYDPEINEESLRARSLKLAAFQKTLKPPPVFGDRAGDLLVIGWGSTKGAIEEAVERLRGEGLRVSSMHLRFLQPLPPGIKEVMARFTHVMTIESNWCDRLGGRDHRREQPAVLGARDAAAVALSRRRRLLERGARPADQAEHDLRRHSQEAARSMTMTTATECLLQLYEERHELEDYQSGVPRWCTRLRRQRDPRRRAAALPRRAAAAREDGVRVGHRLLEPLPALHADVRLPRHPRPRAADRRRHPDGAARPARVREHRRRRLLQHRRGALDPRASATT